MSTICSACGCPVDEFSGICPNCGASVSGSSSFDAGMYDDPLLQAASEEEQYSESVPEAPAAPPVSSTPTAPPQAPKKPAEPLRTSPKTPPEPQTPQKKKSGCGCCLGIIALVLALAFLVGSGFGGELLGKLESMLGSELPQSSSDPLADAYIPDDAVELNGHYYYLYTLPIDSYEGAMLFCQDRGGYLATVTSDEESQFLYDYILSLELCEYAYLGGTDAAEEGVWVWSNGEPFDYTNWNSGEPNNDLDGEHQMAIHPLLDGGMWNDIAYVEPSFYYQYPGVVDIEASSTLNDKKKYAPAAVSDGDLYTAWNDGVDGITGESITHYFDGEYALTGFEIQGGFQYSDEIYYANARPAAVELSFSDGTVLSYTLEDVRDVLIITFDAPVNAEWVTMTITDAYPGDTYDDLCITELYYHCGTTPISGFLCEWGQPAAE